MLRKISFLFVVSFLLFVFHTHLVHAQDLPNEDSEVQSDSVVPKPDDEKEDAPFSSENEEDSQIDTSSSSDPSEGITEMETSSESSETIEPTDPQSAGEEIQVNSEFRTNLTRGDPHTEFRELSLRILPGLERAMDTPPAFDKAGFSIGASLSLFLHKRIAIHLPYIYTKYDTNLDLHAFGGGPKFRYLDLSFLRGHLGADALWVRYQDSNRIGVSGDLDLTFGKRTATLSPFLGPFLRYTRTFLPGEDLTSMTYGFSITLSNYTDLDL